MAQDLDTRLDDLYGLPPDQFVGARDALAKELQGEERAAVKALRRPSVPAGLANRLAREEPDAMKELLAAGAQLRETQLGGVGDVRAAMAKELAAVDRLVKAARRLDGASGPNIERLRGLLHAAAADPGLQAALERGRVEREPQAGGAWPALDLGAKAEPKPKPKPKAEPKADPDRKRRIAEAQRRRRDCEQAASRAESEADRARERLEHATAATATARAALEEAEEAEVEAREDAQRALRALKAAQAQLQEATDAEDAASR
jgi:hypothetical protein